MSETIEENQDKDNVEDEVVKGIVVETAKENDDKDKVEEEKVEEHETNSDWMKNSLVCRQLSEEENWKWFEDLGDEYCAEEALEDGKECPLLDLKSKPGSVFLIMVDPKLKAAACQAEVRIPAVGLNPPYQTLFVQESLCIAS